MLWSLTVATRRCGWRPTAHTCFQWYQCSAHPTSWNKPPLWRTWSRLYRTPDAFGTSAANHISLYSFVPSESFLSFNVTTQANSTWPFLSVGKKNNKYWASKSKQNWSKKPNYFLEADIETLKMLSSLINGYFKHKMILRTMYVCHRKWPDVVSGHVLAYFLPHVNFFIWFFLQVVCRKHNKFNIYNILLNLLSSGKKLEQN